MKRTGNDVIDLASPLARGRSADSRYVKRVLLPDEEASLAHARDPDILFWMHWASKEASYKAISKIDPHITSNPLKYALTLEASCSEKLRTGVVATPGPKVSVTLFRGNGFIHCIGMTGALHPEKHLTYGVLRIDHLKHPDFERSSAVESVYVRAVVKRKLERYLFRDMGKISISEAPYRNGIFYPEVYLNQERTDVDLSLSHDGRFVAYAFYVNKTLS